jgi:hypothetical protein
MIEMGGATDDSRGSQVFIPRIGKVECRESRRGREGKGMLGGGLKERSVGQGTVERFQGLELAKTPTLWNNNNKLVDQTINSNRLS